MLQDPDVFVPPVLGRMDAADAEANAVPDATAPPSTNPPPQPAPTPAPTPSPAPAPAPTSQDASTLPSDEIGDIPPPPIPSRPIVGPGVAGIPGTEAGTFARPGTAAARPFRSPAFFQKRPPRFGPGVPVAGGSADVQGLADLGMGPDEAAELLKALAAGFGTGV